MENTSIKENSAGKIILKFSILFVIISTGIFAVFALTGKSFLQYSDGYRQAIFWLVEFKQNMEGFFRGEGFPLWSWHRGYGADFLYRLDPFNLIGAAFPLKWIEAGYSIALALKFYCGGLAFLIFAMDRKMTEYQCIMGAICYIFSTWYINTMMIQGTFIFVTFVFPVLIMSIDWVYRGKTPVLFIVTVAYCLIRDTYISYMIAIVAIIFMLLRYFAYSDRFNLLDYMRTIGKFVLYGLLAGMISAITSIQFIVTTLNATTDGAENAIPFIFDTSYSRTYGQMLISSGHVYSYTLFGITVLLLLFLPVALKKLSIRRTEVLMTVILLVMTLFPFFCFMFNAFSYSTGRWFFMAVFFACWSSVEILDVEKLACRSNILLMTAWIAVLGIWTVGMKAAGLSGMSLRGTAFILMNLAAGAAIILCLVVLNRGGIKPATCRKFTVIIVAGTLMASWSLSFYLNIDKFIFIGEVGENMEGSVLRASKDIDDEDFFRTDFVNQKSIEEGKMPSNENLWWKANTITGYDSFTTADQFRYNKALGNNYSYIMRVYVLSNNNRMGLDFLSGVRYFLGSDKKKPGDRSDDYAGYSFDYSHDFEGVSIFKNRYDAGIGYGYGKIMKESEFMKLNRLEREQALLQAAVIPDESMADCKGKEITCENLDIDIDEVDWEIEATDGAEASKGRIIVHEKGGGITLKLSDVKDSQLVVSFDNLERDKDGTFTIKSDSGQRTCIEHYTRTNQAIGEIRDFDMNLGYYRGFDGTVKISFSAPGEYTFDRMSVSAMSAENFDTYARERMGSAYDADSYDPKHVFGKVSMKEDGVLYLSVPQYRNWQIYVDGEKAQRIDNVNLAFTGVNVSAGEHIIEMKYFNRYALMGIMISIFGIIVTAIIGLRRKK